MHGQRKLIDRPIPRHPLGLTGDKVSILAVGSFYKGSPPDPEIDVQAAGTAQDYGADFLDNARCYHDGRKVNYALTPDFSRLNHHNSDEQCPYYSERFTHRNSEYYTR
jgi:hypothetical protein